MTKILDQQLPTNTIMEHLSPSLNILLPSTSLTFLTAPIPVLPDFHSVVHQQGAKEDYEWLESAYDDMTSYWVPWAKHHARKHQSVVREPDISTILAPIDGPVHTLDIQYHCINIVSDTINTLNPDQIPVDTADQPVFPLTKKGADDSISKQIWSWYILLFI